MWFFNPEVTFNSHRDNGGRAQQSDICGEVSQMVDALIRNARPFLWLMM
jgi:hypothetical protein